MLGTLNVVMLASTVVLSAPTGVETRFGQVFGSRQLAAAVSHLETATEVETRFRAPTSFQAKERGKAKRVMWALIGGAGGFFGGGYLGAALEPDCSCDDPGLQGWLIGAPIGAATGAILGWVFGR